MGGHQGPALRSTMRVFATPGPALFMRGLRLGGARNIACRSANCVAVFQGLRWLSAALAAGTPTALALSGFGVTLRLAIVWGIRAGIGNMRLRQSRSVTGFPTTPAFATTGTLRIPFFHRRRPRFRRLYAVTGVSHCFIHSAARKLIAMLLAFIKLRCRNHNSAGHFSQPIFASSTSRHRSKPADRCGAGAWERLTSVVPTGRS